MKVNKTKLAGVCIIEPDQFTDVRGELVVSFAKKDFENLGLNWSFEQSYYSVSKKNVIRGMHFQTPPQDHVKLVHVTNGAVLDVVLDIRKNSPTYKQFLSIELSSENKKMIYIPRGCAHGFISLVDNSQMVYFQDKERSPEHEGGILYDSFGMNWGIGEFTISERDKTLPKLENFVSPF